MEDLSQATIAGLIGLLGGAALGLAARLGRFCTLGAIEDALYGGDLRRVRMWSLAIAVAIIGVFACEALGALDTRSSVYARSVWNPLASIFGGLVFGYGMAIAGNCGFGALAQAAGGEMRSFLILTAMGVAAYMALLGPLAPLRLAAFPPEPAAAGAAAGLAHDVGGMIGLAPIAIAFVVAAALVVFAFASAAFGSSARHVFWSVVVGLAIASGWAGTAYLAATNFGATPVESHNFTAPVGETLIYLMTSGGGGVGFSVGSVFGVILGAVLGSLLQGSFRWEACDDSRELRRQIFGAALMGVGGVVALGCSIGQGLTAFSMLAWSAPVTLAAIVVGAVIGLRQLIEGRFLFIGARTR